MKHPDDWVAKCFVCNSKRKFKYLDVRAIDMYPDDPGIAIFNLRYCNDSLSCIGNATNITLEELKESKYDPR